MFLIRKVTLSFLTLNKITEKQTQIHRNEYKTKMQKRNLYSDIICIYFNLDFTIYSEIVTTVKPRWS